MPAWFLALLLLLAAWPWARWLVVDEGDRQSFLLPALLTLALGSGALTLGMFWLGLTGTPFTLPNTTMLYLLLMLPGVVLWWRCGHPLPRAKLPGRRIVRVAALLLLPLCLGAMFNSAWWPFSRDDAVWIYERFGLEMFSTGSLVPLRGERILYEAYPLHIPLGYTWSYLAAGWPNEFLARIFATLPGLACLAAAGALGNEIRGKLSGALAALLVGFTTAFGNWVSSGYVDLPAAFFITLSVLFAWRLWRCGRWQDAVLAGLLCGLAAWTKNAALISCALLALWLLPALLRSRVRRRVAALALLACVLVAGPWYLRNLLAAGLVIPDTVWTEQAQQNLNSALVLFTRPGTFGLAGVLIQAGLLLSIARILHTRRLDPPDGLLLFHVLPWFAVWWLYASYDPRFVLLFLPLLAVLAALRLEELSGRIPALWRRRLLLPVSMLVVAIALQAGLGAIDFKAALVNDPLMNVCERRALVWHERQPARLDSQSPCPT